MSEAVDLAAAARALRDQSDALNVRLCTEDLTESDRDVIAAAKRDVDAEAFDLEQRVREAARLGYSRAVVPPLHASEKSLLKSVKGLELVQVRTVSAAIEQLT